VIETVGLSEQQNNFPSELSGGQKQRLYFAIALVGNPQLLILDEPTTSLDPEGREVFWTQVTHLRQRGVTILMVTHSESDQDRLKKLAPHILTLADGKLNFDQFLTPTNQLESKQQHKEVFAYQAAKPSQILFKQTWTEILQLLRTPAYLAGVFLFSALSALMPFEKDPAMLQKGVVFFSAISLLIFSIERLGKRVAIERVEGWLKLLKVTPLSPSIYLAAKLIMTMFVLTTSLSIIFAISILKFGFNQSFIAWLTLSSSLLLGIIPFTVIGLALGYIVPPKALDSIAGLLIPIGVFSCGLMPIQEPSYIQALIVLSPFFHYREIVQFAAGIEYDNQLILHMLWLALYTVVASLIAKLAYQRDTLVK
jgi:ABC-2 type transport system ATP-binding protein